MALHKINPDENAGDLLQRHEDSIYLLERKTKALEVAIHGLFRTVLLYTGVRSIIKALKK